MILKILTKRCKEKRKETRKNEGKKQEKLSIEAKYLKRNRDRQIGKLGKQAKQANIQK